MYLGRLAYGLLLTQEEDSPKNFLITGPDKNLEWTFQFMVLQAVSLRTSTSPGGKTKGRSEAELEVCMCTKCICLTYSWARWVDGTALSQCKVFTYICNSLRVDICAALGQPWVSLVCPPPPFFCWHVFEFITGSQFVLTSVYVQFEFVTCNWFVLASA
jgi:hypothetical protein